MDQDAPTGRQPEANDTGAAGSALPGAAMGASGETPWGADPHQHVVGLGDARAPRWRRARGSLAASPPGRAAAEVGRLLAAGLSDPAAVLPVAFIVAFVLRVAWLDQPPHALIFDEAYYVQAARALLGWPIPAGAHYAGSPIGIDPNTEHPPLGKVLMAASMFLFGDNGIGWRVPSVFAGMVCLYAAYQIVRACRETSWFGIAVVVALALENLTLVHSRIATLDILFLAPLLVGSWMALRGRWLLAGIAMGVGLLVKLPAIYGVGAVGLLHLLERGPDWWRTRRVPLRELRPMVVFVLATAVVWVGGLAVLDARFSSYANPIDHIAHMIQYGSDLAGSVARTQHCPGPESLPWQWLFNDCQITYLRVDVTVSAGSTVISSDPSIDFRGAMNPILVGLIPISMLFAAWYAWRADSRMARWAVTWAAANYLPFVLLALVSRRVMYLYYMLPTIPALAVAAVLLLWRSGLPKPVRWGLVAAYVVAFLAYYPFRRIP